MNQAESHKKPGTQPGLSFLNPAAPEPWASFLEQIDRVTPHMGNLARWVETLKHPKRIMIVDVPIVRDDGSVAHYEATACSTTCRAGRARAAYVFTPP